MRDKEKQMSSLKERVKSLQADTTNTDTALTTLEEALAEKVSDWPDSSQTFEFCFLVILKLAINTGESFHGNSSLLLMCIV